MPTILIVGCGEIGQRTARLAQQRGWPVFGTCRSAASVAERRAAGISAHRVDLAHPEGSSELAAALADARNRAGSEPLWLLWLVPPPPQGQDDPWLQRGLAALHTNPPERFIYLGTSGVYGDCQGAWIDEQTPVAPATDRGRRRLAAEQRVTAWGAAVQREVVRLRVTGIYGDGRLPVARLLRGEAILDPALSGYTNRIHADDLAMILLAAAERAPAGALYNVCDGHPSTMSDYLLAVAAHLDLPPPPTVDWQQAATHFSPQMLSYLRESRRISNQHLLQQLQITLNYPDLAAGLAAIDPTAELALHRSG